MFHPDLNDIRRWVASGDMASDLDEAARAKLTDSPEGRRTLKDFQTTFGTDAGQRVLKVLADSSVLRAPVDHRLSGADYMAYAQLRQGQNQLFAMIMEIIALSQETPNGPDPRPTRSFLFDAPGRDAASDAASGDAPGWSAFDPAGDITAG